MNILMISPGYPAEMTYFTRALAAVGARVIGVGDQPRDGAARRWPASTSPTTCRSARSGTSRRWCARCTKLAHQVRIDRVECLWEPGMILAARLREALGLPGMDVAQTMPFRDKEVMKQVLDAAGIRTPHHHRALTRTRCARPPSGSATR